MLEIIKLVAGTVAEKDLIPAFTHIHIYDGRIQGMDGKAVAIDAECSQVKGISATVPADRFLRAVDACEGAPVLTVTDRKLIIKRASFKAMLPLMAHESYPKMEGPSNKEKYPIKVGFVGTLKRLKPFISQDASRPWSCSILFKNEKMYATNNVILVSLPFPTPINMALPTAAVDELIRINQDPKEVLIDDNHLFFLYDNFWIRVNPLSSEWPDIDKLFGDYEYESLPLVPGQLLDAVRKIAHFHPDPKFPVVVFNEEGVHTMDGEHTASVGGVTLPDGKYRAEMISLVLNEAIKADFSKYPGPCPFYGMDKLKGIIVGIRA